MTNIASTAFGLRQPAAAERDTGLAEQRRLLERRHVALAVEVVGHAVGAAGLDAGAGVFVEEADQPVGLGKRQRLEQDAVRPRRKLRRWPPDTAQGSQSS